MSTIILYFKARRSVDMNLMGILGDEAAKPHWEAAAKVFGGGKYFQGYTKTTQYNTAFNYGERSIEHSLYVSHTNKWL